MKISLFPTFLLHQRFQGQAISRKEACRICGATTGLNVAETWFWDLQHCSIIKCNSCGLIQFDPMLTRESTETGCMAYYLWEKQHTSPHDQERNLLRNYRRGILFACQIKKKGFNPMEILEFGPGSGYFVSGIRHVFPDARITVVDIVDEVLSENKDCHGFEVIKGYPENLSPFTNKKFDLIIARDILEHVSDVGVVIRNVSELLKENGLFHFLTPNGYEDVWKHYVHWHLDKDPSESLINHVNYFAGKGLLDFLEQNNMHPLKYYTYQLKTTLRGKGWSMRQSQSAVNSIMRPASETIISSRNGPVPGEKPLNSATFVVKENVLDQWYLRTRSKWLTYLYCWYMHEPLVKINPGRNIGHEIFGLFQKKS